MRTLQKNSQMSMQFLSVLDTQDTEEIIRTVANIAPTFGGINLEDISAPRCFEIEERLKSMLNIPVFQMISTELPSLYWLVSSMPCALPANRKKLAASL